MAQLTQSLYEALRALEHRAVAVRRAAGLPFSRRQAAKAVRASFGVALDAHRIDAWLPAEPARAQVPGDDDALWALVQVWSTWAGDKSPIKNYWTGLAESARSSASRPAAHPPSTERGESDLASKTKYATFGTAFVGFWTAVVGLIAAIITTVLVVHDPAPRDASHEPVQGAQLPPDPKAVFGDKKCKNSFTPIPKSEPITITAPASGSEVAGRLSDDGNTIREHVTGRAIANHGEKVRLLLYASGPCLYYSMADAITVAANEWEGDIYLPASEPGRFPLYAVLVGTEENEQIEAALKEAGRQRSDHALWRLPTKGDAASILIKCCKVTK